MSNIKFTWTLFRKGHYGGHFDNYQAEITEYRNFWHATVYKIENNNRNLILYRRAVSFVQAKAAADLGLIRDWSQPPLIFPPAKQENADSVRSSGMDARRPLLAAGGDDGAS